MNENQQYINEALKSLPPNIKYAIETLNWAEISLEIMNEFNLSMEQLDKFRNITMSVAVGIIPADEYHDALVSVLGVNDEKADKILYRANDLVFDALQEIAFGNKGYQIAHEELALDMENEGVVLLADNEEEEVSDEISFEPFSEKETVETEFAETVKTEAESKDAPQISKPSYQEPISDDDNLGVSGHRINIQNNLDTSKIESQEEKDEYQKHVLEHMLLEQKHVTRVDTLDASPTEGEQVKQDKNFLQTLKDDSVKKPSL